MSNNEMLASAGTRTTASAGVPGWPTLEAALSALLPESPPTLNVPVLNAPVSAFSSDDYLKLYTLVFDYCVGNVRTGSQPPKTSPSTASRNAFMIGEDMYKALHAFVDQRFLLWQQQCAEPNLFERVLAQMDTVQRAEKPLVFIFTYLERHWIDRQLQEQRADVMPVKQMLWSRLDALVLAPTWTAMQSTLEETLSNVRLGQKEAAEELRSMARFVHYLKVIGRPAGIDSDPSGAKQSTALSSTSSGSLYNPLARGPDRFHGDFVPWYTGALQRFLSQRLPSGSSSVDQAFLEHLLRFWNEEEGRMALLRYDRDAVVSIRKALKELLLLPHLEACKELFGQAVREWNFLDANRVYRLLANRKTLLVELDRVALDALVWKGRDYVRSGTASARDSVDALQTPGQLFITLIGQFYNLTGELIHTALANRPELFDVRSRAIRVLLNAPANGLGGRWAAKSLAACADAIVTDFPKLTAEAAATLDVLIALFRLLDEKDVFLAGYCAALGRRKLAEIETEVGHEHESRNESTEAALWARLRETCGPGFVGPLERILGDMEFSRDFVRKYLAALQKRPGKKALLDSTAARFTIITSGTWQCDGRLLPGHSLTTLSLPDAAEEEDFASKLGVADLSAHFKSLYPKRNLTWLPFLTTLDCAIPTPFPTLPRLLIRLSYLQWLVIGALDKASLSPDQLAKALRWPSASSIATVLQPLIGAGLVQHDGPTGLLRYQIDWEQLAGELTASDEEPMCALLDLARPSWVLLNDPSLLESKRGSGSEAAVYLHPQPHSHSHSHPHPGTSSHSFTPFMAGSPSSAIGPGHCSVLSAPDRLLLLQSLSMRLLKQFRRLSLRDLYAQLSMLPVLLTRFSPVMEECMRALWQLVEKEFVTMSVAEIETTDLGGGRGVVDEDGMRIGEFQEFETLLSGVAAHGSDLPEKLFIKYLP